MNIVFLRGEKMRTILIAAVIAILAGIIYQKVVNENMDIKEVADYAKNIIGDMTKQVADALENDQAGKEAVENAIGHVEEFAGSITGKITEETSKKAQEVAENILAENIATDKNITCDIAKNTLLKIQNDEALSTKEEKHIDGLYKTMLNVSDISKDAAFSTIKLIYCGKN